MEACPGGLFWRHIRRSTDDAYPAWHDDEGQSAALDILLRRQYAAGDVAARDQVVLSALQQHIDALGAQAATKRRVVHPSLGACITRAGNGSVQTRQEFRRNIRTVDAGEDDFRNAKAGRFLLGQSRKRIAGHGLLRLCSRGLRLPLAFLLLLLQTELHILLAFQRAPLLNIGIGQRGWSALCKGSATQ